MIILQIAGAVLFVGAIGCAISSSIVLSDMTEDVNRASGRDDQENPMWFTFTKQARIRRKYRGLYPYGSRGKILKRLTVITAILFVVGAALMFAPGKI